MYLEIDEDFPSHPKSVRLCAALNNPVAWAYMIKLWSWARKYQKDGDLSAYTPEEIEVAVAWPKVDGKFYAAVVRIGFIDEARAGETIVRRLHNWLTRTGGAVKRMEEEAQRKRCFRLHKSGKCDSSNCPHCLAGSPKGGGPSGGRPPDGDANGAGRRTAGSDQDKTSPDQASQGKASQVKIDRAPADGPRIGPSTAQRRWSAREWFDHFKRAWCLERQTMSYGGPPADFRATRDLEDMLAALAVTDALAAEERADAMFGEYFASGEERLAEARYPWSWFVPRFNGLRLPRPQKRPDPKAGALIGSPAVRSGTGKFGSSPTGSRKAAL